jgi:hypothetical protein
LHHEWKNVDLQQEQLLWAGNNYDPTGPSAINLRAVGNFVALTAAGAIAKQVFPTYNGDIATGLGCLGSGARKINKDTDNFHQW